MLDLWYVVVLFVAPAMVPGVYAHTVDSVEDYRLEIGWMNEPVISRETNGIELRIGQLDPCTGDHAGCAMSQEFKNGIAGLAGDLKMQLVFEDEKTTLPLVEDHNIAGKYHAFVNPTASGFYQVNLLGEIRGTPVSISMHPPKVSERSDIEFPEPEDQTIKQIIDGHAALVGEIGSIKKDIKAQAGQLAGISYAGMAMGAAGIAIAILATVRHSKS